MRKIVKCLDCNTTVQVVQKFDFKQCDCYLSFNTGIAIISGNEYIELLLNKNSKYENLEYKE